MNSLNAAQKSRIHEVINAFKAWVERSTDAKVAPLRARIKALEERPQMRYRGVWHEGMECRVGDLVTHSGSIFYCHAPTTKMRPGPSADFQLAVKRGANGKDAAR